MGSIEAGQTLRFGTLEVRPLHTPGHTAGMLSFLVGERSEQADDGAPVTRTREPSAARRSRRRRGGRVHRRHPVQGLSRRGQGAGPHHLHRSARLDHGHADGAAARHRHLPGPRRADHRRAGVGLQPLHPRLAGPRPRGLAAAARRSASPPRWCCSAPTTTAAPRPGCAGRTARTTSSPGRRCSAARSGCPSAAVARAKLLLDGAGPRQPSSMQGMARENEKIPTSRARRTATVATLAASEAVKQFGTRAANVTRGEEASEEAMARRQLETAKQIVAVLGHDEGRRHEARAGDVLPGRRPRRRGAPRGVPARARQAARRRPDRVLQADAAGDRGGPRRADLRGVRVLR